VIESVPSNGTVTPTEAAPSPPAESTPAAPPTESAAPTPPSA
jgi:hypothetical protein